jgi:hypothetical protein
MELLIVNVNWVAVFVGTIASFALGWLWYSPKLFGTKWAQGIGITVQDGSGPTAQSLITQFVGTFLLAWVIGVTETTNALPLAILTGLMVSALIEANGLFSQKNIYAIATEAGFVLSMVLVMILTHVVL